MTVEPLTPRKTCARSRWIIPKVQRWLSGRWEGAASIVLDGACGEAAETQARLRDHTAGVQKKQIQRPIARAPSGKSEKSHHERPD